MVDGWVAGQSERPPCAENADSYKRLSCAKMYRQLPPRHTMPDQRPRRSRRGGARRRRRRRHRRRRLGGLQRRAGAAGALGARLRALQGRVLDLCRLQLGEGGAAREDALGQLRADVLVGVLGGGWLVIGWWLVGGGWGVAGS
jgi:hypothetical protein